MARSPFQGTWQDGIRPTVVTAPDAIVYINGQSDIVSCDNCKRRFDFNKYITSLQVDLNVDNAPGSASISLSIPRHTIDDFFVDGVPVVSPMMEVEIYAKGYYLVGGLPQYYPIFWGLITEVSDNYSGGDHTVSISCADILKWWELCRLNVNPAMTQAAGQLGQNYITGNAFDGANVYDIIWTLAQQSMGDIIQAKGSLVSVTREQQFGGVFNGLRRDIMSYWNSRFGQMRSSLLLYGVQGAAVRGDVIYSSRPSGRAADSHMIASAAVRNANGGTSSSQLLFDPINTVRPFRTNISNSASPNFWQSEFQTKLEIANICKEAVGFEFYMDVTGDIVFKPPFYNLDILANKPISWIQDIDIIDWNLSESEAEVITQLQISGTYEGGGTDYGATSDVSTHTTQVTDYHMLRQYGWRVQSVNADYLNSDEALFYAGLDMLDRVNARRHRASVSIPMRPEMRLGFPVYLAPKDQIWYVSGISHNLTFGGRAQTTLTLTARRGKFIAPKGIGTIQLTNKPQTSIADTNSDVPLTEATKPSAADLSASGRFKIVLGDAAQIPPVNLPTSTLEGTADDPYAPLILRHPKTGRIVGYPNVNLTYVGVFSPDDATLKHLLGDSQSTARKTQKLRNQDDQTAAQQNLDNVKSGLVQTLERTLFDRHMDNRYFYGMTSAGLYSYVHDDSQVLQEIVQIPIANLDVTPPGAVQTIEGTATIRPVSDERGFEVVGHYRYGRGISLRDGSLVLTSDGLNRSAPVDTQLALAGGLFESLHAQSQGLTALTSAYPNPADAVARLTVSDTQTAAAINPETGEPSFVDNGNNFIDSAPLNSPANAGQPASVEVSQLSKALTVAEMRVRDPSTPVDPTCPCLLGRADLAFINVGYQVQFLKGTAPDYSSTLQTSVSRQLAAAQEQLADVQRQISANPSADDLADLTVTRDELQTQISNLTANQASNIISADDPSQVVLDQRDFSSPVAPRTALDTSTTLNRVEQFLADLYETLDGVHQSYEDAIRGKLIDGPTRSALISSNETTPQPSPFSPPFSAPNRAVGGDPAALAIQGSTARADLTTAWKQFGDNLRTKPQQAALTQQIADTQKRLQNLDLEEQRLEQSIATGSPVISTSGVPVSTSASQQLAALEQQRAQLTQQLDNANAKLRQLEASQ